MARNIAPLDITWFIDLNTRDLLDLSPPYQRKSVWTPKERRYFLDTILNGYPCPPLFLYKSLTDEGVATYHVVDGKQRLETIFTFVQNKLALADDISDNDLAGKKWKSLDVEQKKKFWNYQLAVEMLDTVDTAVVKEIFDRYNRTSKNLERQELRHAKYDGWLITTAEEESKKQEWRTLGIVTTANARRMKDVQFISELMLMLIKNEVSGFDQDELDEFYAQYDTPSEFDPTFSEDDFIEKFEKIKNLILELESHSNLVTTYGKSFTNFYSLWSAIALTTHDLPEIPIIAKRYKDFMDKASTMLKSANLDDFASQELSVEDKKAFIYASNARGANTELPQRKQRHEQLSDLLFTGQIENENQQ